KGIASVIKTEESNVSSILASLDCVYTSDQALDIAGEYSKIIKQIDGNIQNWKNLLALIEEITEGWQTTLKRKLETMTKRLQSQIYRKQDEVKAVISKLETIKSNEMFKLTEWLSKQRNLLTLKIHEKHGILLSFLTQYIQRAEKLLSDDSEPEHALDVVRKMIGEIQDGPELNDVISRVIKELNDIEKEVNGLEDEVKKREEEIENKYHKSLEQVGADLPKLFAMKEEKTKALEQEKMQIEKKANEIKALISKIIENCINERNYLMRWSLPGVEMGIVVPLAKKYVPLYVAGITRPDEEEKLTIIPPIILLSKHSSADFWLPFEFVNESFKSFLKDRLEKALDINFELRSNFEFNCEKKNLLQNVDVAKYRIMRGFETMKAMTIIEEAKVEKIKESWRKNSLIHEKNA
ncbi:MAG: hypothetical protein ACXQS8_09865, partial [Candidatus Helarchaeales archaeon]